MTISTKGDSEGELQDQTPDTDDSGTHSYPEVSSFSSSGATSSFKRAPIMGNRGLEQRGKKSRTYPPKETQNTQKVKSACDKLICKILNYVFFRLFKLQHLRFKMLNVL